MNSNNNTELKSKKDIEQEINMMQDKIEKNNKIIKRIANFKRNMIKSLIINLFISIVLTLLIYIISPLIYGVYPTIFICLPGIFLATIILFLPDYLKEKKFIKSYDIDILNKEIVSLTNSINLKKEKSLVNNQSKNNCFELVQKYKHFPIYKRKKVKILEKKNTNK